MSNVVQLLHPSVASSLDAHKISYEVMECDPALADTAAFCEHYNVLPSESANCIIAVGKSDPPKYACCLVLATCKLDVNRKLSQLLGIKKCSFASADQTLEMTSMMIGGVTPFGVSGMPIYIDAEVMNSKRVVLGGGNRSSKVCVSPAELLKLSGAQVVEGLAIPR